VQRDSHDSAAPPDLTVLIPTHNRGDLLEACLIGLQRSNGVTLEVIVVDDASSEDLSPIRSRHPEVGWIRSNENVGYAAANNLGQRGARGRHVVYLNSDVEVEPDCLRMLLDELERRPAVGAILPLHIGPDGEPQPILSPEHTLGMAWLRDSALHLAFPRLPVFRRWTMSSLDLGAPAEVATAQTSCMVVRGQALGAVGGMDPDLFLFYNDVDLCRRLRSAGWTILYYPQARVLHHGGATTQALGWREAQLWRDRYRFFGKHYGRAGCLGVRVACMTRAIARTAAQLPRLRFRQIGDRWAVGMRLYGALGSLSNGPDPPPTP